MSISCDDVKNIAHLARLAISDDEITEYSQDLSKIFDLIATMEQVDTSAVEPMAHPLQIFQRLREDVVTETNQRSEHQAIAPSVEAGLYLVPKVIDEV